MLALLLPAIVLMVITPVVAFASNDNDHKTGSINHHKDDDHKKDTGSIILDQSNACAMISPIHDLTSGEDTYGKPVLTGSLHDVLTPSGHEHIVCKITIPGYHAPEESNSDGSHTKDHDSEEVHFDYSNTGVLCNSAYGVQVSTDWHEEVSESGKATFTCTLTGVTLP
jgi:hypothetical protein